ncbi:MAG: glycosyltransferase family 4 protein [Phycisphaeraceae bacterium]
MHVVLIANSTWLDEELTAFRQLAVGMLDEQVRVTQVVPAQLPLEDAISFGDRLSWLESSWSWLRRRRLAGLAESLEKTEPDILHAMHAETWEGAMLLAEELEAGVVLHVSRAEDVAVALKLRVAIEASRAAFTASTQPLADAMIDALGKAITVVVVRPGVHPQDLEEPAKHAEQPLCAVISGEMRYDDNYRALFTAMRSIISEYNEVQFFIDTPGSEGRELWLPARKLGLVRNLSIVPHRLGHRELELEADVIIHPQALGRSRSMTLQAMAAGIPVLARSDRWLDYLIDDETAWIVDTVDATRWEELLRHLIVAPENGRELGRKAHQYVRDHHLVSRQVGDTLDLYRKVTGEAMKFPGAAAV